MTNRETRHIAVIGGGIHGCSTALHAARAGLDISYRTSTIEEIVSEGQRFDVVLALEVVEHVAEPAEFVARCCDAVVEAM